ncbi:MAG: ABC transporter substrate-binding protein [Pseudomonadota bacterium]|nr:ABC transporter substrate-binding protein [Pseudomonadota bacterium]
MTDPLIGRTLKDTYRIDRMLADGGMSRVYLAEQLSLARKVVVKMLLPSFHDEDFIQLFLREARICSQLNHPNIVSVLDFGHTEDGLVYLILEYLEGAALGDIVHQQKGLTLANIVWLMEPLCSAINAAHQHNVVHRDLKPGNVMVATLSGNETTVKVVDFGISKPMHEENLKHTQLGTVMGTPGYLAPEQIRGANINHLADIYGIGAILHFMITGEAPYRGASREIIMNKQMKELPPPLSSYSLRDPSCEILQPIIYKAMAVEREQRYGSTAELWREFSACARQTAQLQQQSAAASSTTTPGDALFQFIFQGELQAGHEPQQVQQNLHKAFKFSDPQLQALFSGKRVVLRKNISERDARRFQQLFEKCGAVGLVEEMDDRTRIVSPQAPAAATSMPEPGVAQPISVAGFVQAGNSPFVSESPSSPQSFADANAQHSAASASLAGVANKSKPRRNLLRAVFTSLAVAAVFALVIYAVPAWRYTVGDAFMYSTGLAQPQRGISSEGIKLGMSAAFSGSARELGRSMRIGMQAYFNRINEQGGLHGRQLNLYSLDDGYEPARAVANLQAMLHQDDGVFALLGNVGTPTSKAILPEVLRNKTLLFGTFSGAQLLRNNPPDRYVFNYRASYAEETAALVHYFVKILEMNPRNIAVFYQNDSFGKDGLAGVSNAIAHYGVDIHQLPTATYERNTDRVMDAMALFRPLIPTLEGVIVIGAYPASARFTKLMSMSGYQGRIANVSFVGAKALAEELRESETNGGAGVIVSQVVPIYNGFSSGVLEYQEAMQAYFPSEPLGFVSLEGYVVARLFCLALAQSGRYFNTEEVIRRLEALQDVDLGIGRPLSFSASDHQASHQVWGSIINANGQFEALDLEKFEAQ